MIKLTEDQIHTIAWTAACGPPGPVDQIYIDIATAMAPVFAKQMGEWFDNGISVEIKQDDSRQEGWAIQRAERGFDNTELWNLDVTFAKFIYPRLKAFRENLHSHPGDLTLEEWEVRLDKMLVAFDRIRDGRRIEGCDHDNVIEEGFELFAKHYFNLWS